MTFVSTMLPLLSRCNLHTRVFLLRLTLRGASRFHLPKNHALNSHLFVRPSWPPRGRARRHRLAPRPLLRRHDAHDPRIRSSCGQRATFSAWAAQSAKCAPNPSQVAPKARSRPGQTRKSDLSNGYPPGTDRAQRRRFPNNGLPILSPARRAAGRASAARAGWPDPLRRRSAAASSARRRGAA